MHAHKDRKGREGRIRTDSLLRGGGSLSLSSGFCAEVQPLRVVEDKVVFWQHTVSLPQDFSSLLLLLLLLLVLLLLLCLLVLLSLGCIFF